MPAFMFLSGYVTSNKLTKKWVISRCFSLLVTFFIWTCIKCTFNIERIIDCLIYVDRSFWFIQVLALVTMFAYFAVLLSSKIGVWAFAVVNIFLLVIPESYFGIGIAKFHFTWYALGYIMPGRISKISDEAKERVGKICSLMWVLFVIFWYRTGLPSFAASVHFDGLYGKIFYLFCKIYQIYVVPFLGIVMVSYIFHLLWKHISSYEDILQFAGRYTMACYVLQNYFFITPFSNRLINSVFSFVLAFFVPIGIGWIVAQSKWLNFILFCGKMPKK